MCRVVVTGMGVISPVGNDIDTFWESLKAGKCGVDKIKRFDASGLKVSLDAEVKEFEPKKYYDTVQEIRKSDLFMQYAMAAARQAVEQSGILESELDKERFGVYIGSGIGGINTTIRETRKLDEKGPEMVSPFFVPMMISNMAAGAVSIKFGAKGPTLPIVTACATSTHTIGEAYRVIKHGYADAIIAGGSEASINELAMAGFINCQALNLSEDPSEGSIPFDKRRGGFVMGEGAGILILEEYEHAKKRGAKIYAEVVGYGNTSDAYHITAPDPEGDGAVRAIQAAVNEAKVSDSDEIYFNAHGTGTHLNDAMETKAIKKVFGKKAYDIHISSTKSMTGHMMGATGAVEAIASVLALNDGIIPPTINYKEKDEECDLNYTVNKAEEVAVDYAISTSLGFGGHNACIAFKKVN
ncbi:MAG: beta-ketoacyl-ACP synthase II [Butyrivibrio sp.]|uniref:3-oxoacyl-[acyl-carrier-protein] synthase 2 n=1 Tax=Butyrivibrio hungatei TaxID=185008 RepID=A0A1G5CXH1_9FIRM|nr:MULTISPECIES: beta-ketoacyl-ACP synthase II [Butyrivibrio]MBQ2610374.1 beta-ketoacyl-ACP synthase II [Butyrivibrio sp.]SCY07112.1 3-oxoacyl-[acyl-carrier-protein] synthase II [Butyrivibrio hungatei]